MGKITVKHFLNINLKPYVVNGDYYYKLYFLLRYQNKNTKIKSLTNIELTENEFNKILSNEDCLTYKKIINEVRFIESVIKSINKSKIIFDFKIFNDYWLIATYPIIEKFRSFIDWQYEKYSNNEIDIYHQVNFETYEFIYEKLKLFVIDSPLCISDEIYFKQLYDKELIKAIEKSLKTHKTVSIWKPQPTDRTNIKIGDIVKLEYKETKINAINLLINSLFVENYFQIPFNLIDSYKHDKQNYLKKIINSLSVT